LARRAFFDDRDVLNQKHHSSFDLDNGRDGLQGWLGQIAGTAAICQRRQIEAYFSPNGPAIG
jgi:hypothetical protein